MINSRALVRRMAIQFQPRRILKMEPWLASLATSLKHHFKVRQVVRLLRVLAHRVERKQPFGKSIRQDDILYSVPVYPFSLNKAKYVTRMGELEPWIDENFVRNLWFQMGEQVNVKMIRDKFSG